MSRSDRADDGHWNSTDQPRNETESQRIEDTGADTNADNNPRRDDDPTQSDTREPRATASERHAIRNGPPHERTPQTTAGGTSSQRATAGSHDAPETTAFRLIALTFAGVGSVLLYASWLLIGNAGFLSGYAPWLGPSVTALGLVVGGLGVVNLTTAYGVWTFTPWGRRLGIWLAALSLVGNLLTLTGTGAGGIVGLLLYGGIAWYLYDNREAYAQLRESQQRNTA
jgi:hypothetical protein